MKKQLLIQDLARYTAFPILMVGLSYLSFYLINQGMLLNNAVVISTTLLFFILLFLEKLIPYQLKWNKDSETLNDIFHTFFGTVLGAYIGNTLLMLTFHYLGNWLQNSIDVSLWPSHLPITLQVIFVFLLSDLGRYVQHRLAHQYDSLWKFHELHHDCPNLNVFKTSRSNIFERITQQLFMYGPLFILGMPQDIFMYFLVPNSLLGLLVHANIDLRIGFLENIIMGPNAHKLHHSINLKEGNTNFGSALVIWDRIFGTYTNYLDDYQKKKIEVGVPKRNILSRNMIKQALYPFFQSK
jgi:sterol desaturase/sphingolipid hydroxylase (fatty acid hydroxylase superfamily)